ncbi:MAG TPA: hypothetical protein VMC09_03170 [Anaerolineales bacterium]|nr:hypothetical protein [Anaerolineales bacterium]
MKTTVLPLILNRHTRLYVTIQGILGGVIAMVHGLAEVLQGNRPTGGNWLVSIGAFTLIHNYRTTGVATLLVGLALLAWTVGWIQARHGAAIFLGIAIVLFLVGGGVAQVLFFLIAWAVATQIRSPLDWWRDHLPERTNAWLAGSWPWAFGLGYFFLAVGILIWLIWTPPSAAYKNSIAQYSCWACLSVGVLFQLLTIVAGFARDLRQKER